MFAEQSRPFLVLTALLSVTFTTTTMAGSHLWRFNEVFSDASGKIQFVELKESAGASSETLLINKWVESDTTGQQFIFPENLVPPTSNKYLLLATAAFADLPGAPTPAYIVPDGFFSLGGDTLSYWTYPAATMTWLAGEVPTDGILSLNIDGSTSANSPTNYAGETGFVAGSGAVPAASSWGVTVLALVILAAGSLLWVRRRQAGTREAVLS